MNPITQTERTLCFFTAAIVCSRMLPDNVPPAFFGGYIVLFYVAAYSMAYSLIFTILFFKNNNNWWGW